MKTSFLRLSVVAAVAGLAACTNYGGHKLGPDGVLPPGVTGIPYTMTKPEYTVDVAADSEDPSKAVYTLSKTDVPDPNQRYTIALDPALFADSKFTVRLGDNGNLTEANSVVTSRVVTTIKTVGVVALNHAKGAYDKSAEAEKSALERYRIFLQTSGAPVCIAHVMHGGTVAFKIDRTIQALADKGELEKEGTGPDAAASGYFYTSLGERDCLTAVRMEVDITTPDYVKVEQKEYDQATRQIAWLDSAVSTETIKTAKIIVEAVKGWVKTKDEASITRAATYTGKHYREGAGLDDFMTAARDYVKQEQAADDVKALAKAFDLKPEVWRARAVKFIGRDIETLRLEKDLSGDEGAEIASKIVDRERHRADLVGGIALYERIENIDAFLRKVRTVRAADGGVRYAAEEHIKLREERDKLEAQLQGLIASTTLLDTKGANKVKVKPLAKQKVRLASQAFVDEVNAGLGVLFDAPDEFVLVLEREEGGNFSDLPTLKVAKEVKK